MESFFYDDAWNPRRPCYASPSAYPKPNQKRRAVSIPINVGGSNAAAAAQRKVAREEAAAAAQRRVAREEAAAAAQRRVAREEAAVRIQRVFRGYLVRRSLGRVRRIAAEVDEAERRIAAEAAAIGSDARERMRVGEMLMGLLLRLDSVRGVREYRRKVIRRVIALQGDLDSISPADSVVETRNSETLAEAAREAAAADETLERSDLCDLEEESEAGDEDEDEDDAPNSAPVEAEIAAETAAAADDSSSSSSRRSDLSSVGMEEGALEEELCERSAEQCLIMAGLVKRVERLERAIRRMETKKKTKQLGH